MMKVWWCLSSFDLIHLLIIKVSNTNQTDLCRFDFATGQFLSLSFSLRRMFSLRRSNTNGNEAEEKETQI